MMMRRWIRVLGLFGALVLTDVMTGWVTSRNQTAGVYPADADSIGLPIVNAVVFSLAALPFVVIVGLFSVGRVWRFLKAKSVFIQILIGAAFLFCNLVCLLFAVIGFASWCVENHCYIALSYAVFAIVWLGCLLDDV